MCRAPDCERPAETSLGYCVMHYKRWKRNGTTERVLNSYPVGSVCSHCSVKPPKKDGLCQACYTRKLRKGYPDRDMAPQGTGCTTKAGYRLITVDGERVYEHRHVTGALPGEVVHHEEARDDNDEDNLIVFSSQSDHMKYHARKRREE